MLATAGLAFIKFPRLMWPRLILLFAVVATTYAGPIVRFAAAPAVAIAFWRLVLVLPIVFVPSLREGRQGWRESSGLMVVAGLLLATHFWLWIASLRFTTVASSVLLVNLRPIFVWVMAAGWLGEHPGKIERWGILAAVLGAALISGGDARLSSGALIGDALALVAALAAAGYSVIGRRVRRSVGVWTYVSTVYNGGGGRARGRSLRSCRGRSLTGFGKRDGAVFAGLALGQMLIGHTGYNFALKHFRATTVNVGRLGEPVGRDAARLAGSPRFTWRSRPRRR